ncbi:hypothetical protein NQ318_003303 [Aromia moschata]|uniref:Phosphatidylethanolamine-binding protein n=1 Tax=Aromia moschata TaxID=1265417 RepID=A0AAV8YLS1_9CUCU|nr:hypothetical protein NQ318_003303 [Aromia moschata]
MNKSWTAKKVVPEVIAEVPSSKLEVKYPEVAVNEGNVLKPVQVKSPPQVSWKYDENSLYTLCMTDPDAPSRIKPTAREWHHWLVVNIPETSVSKGEILSEYIGAGPPKGSGLHRYVLVVYKQPGKITCDEERLTNKSGKGRAKFSIKKFAEKYNLGQPVAGNFFEAEFDDYVLKLYKQLGN